MVKMVPRFFVQQIPSSYEDQHQHHLGFPDLSSRTAVRGGEAQPWRFAPCRRKLSSKDEESQALCGCVESEKDERAEKMLERPQRNRGGFLAPKRNSRDMVLHSSHNSRRSVEDSDEEDSCACFCYRGDESHSDRELPSTTDEEKIVKHLGKFAWLPRWARHRLVVKLAYRFALQDKQLPLGIVAGAAISNALLVTFARALFSVCFLILVLQSVHCDTNGFAVFHWKIWCAWIPFQFLCSTLELMSFRVIALPKLQVLNRPSVCGLELSFYVWLSFQLLQSIMGSLDLASDGAFLGAQWQVKECEKGMLFEDIWQNLWHESLLGRIGMDMLVPTFTVTCVVTWTLNLVPIAISLSQVLACTRNRDGVDFDICHDANPASFRATGVDIDFDNNGQMTVQEDGEWNTSYPTTWQHLTCDEITKQNHGAALMSLSEVNSWQCIVFSDYEFADAKAKAVYKANPKAAADHVLSQTKRQTQRAAGGALTNGLQLNLQMTAISMLQYDNPFTRTNLQSFFSIGIAAILLWVRIITAITVLYKSWRWETKLRESIRKPTKTFRTASDSIAKWRETLPAHSILAMLDRNREPVAGPEPEEHDYPVTVTVRLDEPDFTDVKPLMKSIRLLLVALLVCIMCMGYGLAKFIMMFHCPYSLWNVSGCWMPSDEIVQLENVKRQSLANHSGISSTDS